MNAQVPLAWTREASAARRGFDLLREAWASERPAWLVSTSPFRAQVRIALAAASGPGGSAPLDLSSWSGGLPSDPMVEAVAASSAVGPQTSEIGPWYNVSADAVFARFDWRSPEDQSSAPRSSRPTSDAREKVPESLPDTESAAAPPEIPASDSESDRPISQDNYRPGSLPASDAGSAAALSSGGGALADAFADFDWK